MSRNYAILALLLVAASGCPAAFAGDFVPRATSGYAPASDDAGAHAGRAAATTAMNESECAPAVRTPDTDAVPATSARRAAHLGTDDATGGAHAALPPSAPAADGGGDDKPAPASPHKARALRWQSLLPGVMK